MSHEHLVASARSDNERLRSLLEQKGHVVGGDILRAGCRHLPSHIRISQHPCVGVAIGGDHFYLITPPRLLQKNVPPFVRLQHVGSWKGRPTREEDARSPRPA